METSSLTREELAMRWNIVPTTLDRWRRKGTGPQYSKTTDSGIRYKVSDVEEYENSRTYKGTADYPPELRRKKKS